MAGPDGAPLQATDAPGQTVSTRPSPPAAPAGPAGAPRAAVDRAAALAAGPPGIPRTFVYWVLAAVVVLGLGGLVSERLFSSTGLNPVAPAVHRPPPTPPTVPAAAVSPAPLRAAPAVTASLRAFMGLTQPAPRPAPSFSLIDQHGQSVSVPAHPPRVVILSFFDAPCDDICPVLAAELQQADADLGARATAVQFVTVNTDPLALAPAAGAAAVSTTGLGTLPNWHMVTGPLPTLDALWRAYGVSISVDPASHLEAHNDVLDFIDARGDLRYRATPFSDESPTGVHRLTPADIARWAQGIATYARQLVVS
jgi:protein SCO1/2